MNRLITILFLFVSMPVSAQIEASFREGDYIFYSKTFKDPVKVHRVSGENLPDLWEYGIPYCAAAIDLSENSRLKTRELNGLMFIEGAKDLYGREIFARQQDENLQPIITVEGIIYNGRYLTLYYQYRNFLKEITINAGNRMFLFFLINPYENNI